MSSRAGGYDAVQEQGARDDAASRSKPPPTATPTPEAEETEAAEEEAAGPPPVWTIQPGGRLGFTVTSGSDSYRGSFSDWSGAIRFDPDNPESADMRIDRPPRQRLARRRDDGRDAARRRILRLRANPTATWRSTSVRRTGPNRYSASGTLSLKGASRPQSLTFTLSGEGLRRHVEGSASIDRTAFGVGDRRHRGGARQFGGAQLRVRCDRALKRSDPDFKFLPGTGRWCRLKAGDGGGSPPGRGAWGESPPPCFAWSPSPYRGGLLA